MEINNKIVKLMKLDSKEIIYYMKFLSKYKQAEELYKSTSNKH